MQGRYSWVEQLISTIPLWLTASGWPKVAGEISVPTTYSGFRFYDYEGLSTSDKKQKTVFCQGIKGATAFQAEIEIKWVFSSETSVSKKNFKMLFAELIPAFKGTQKEALGSHKLRCPQ